MYTYQASQSVLSFITLAQIILHFPAFFFAAHSLLCTSTILARPSTLIVSFFVPEDQAGYYFALSICDSDLRHEGRPNRTHSHPYRYRLLIKLTSFS